MRPPEDAFLLKLSPVIIAPPVAQLLENVGRGLGALSNNNGNILPWNNSMFNLSPLGSFTPYGRNTREMLPPPCLPPCLPFSSLLLSLNLPETHYGIFRFSTLLAYGLVTFLKSFKGNLSSFNTSLLLLVCVWVPVLDLQGAAHPLGPISYLLGTHNSVGEVLVGRSSQGTI